LVGELPEENCVTSKDFAIIVVVIIIIIIIIIVISLQKVCHF